MIHLHHAYKHGSKAMEGLRLGMAACGGKSLPTASLTSAKAAATCKACLAAAARWEAAAPPAPPPAPPPAALPAPLGKANGRGRYPPSGPTPTTRQRAGLPAGNGTITLRVPRNPRKPGSGQHARFALLLAHNGKTVTEFLAAGGNPQTLKNAISQNLAEVKS
jgi:hypothetical protein